jgi:hypothetical protein
MLNAVIYGEKKMSGVGQYQKDVGGCFLVWVTQRTTETNLYLLLVQHLMSWEFKGDRQ